MIRLLKSLSLCVLFAASSLYAESKNPADYPLRIHIFGREQTTFYHNRYADEAKGTGRANVFENSAARAVDFSYDCSEKLRASFGYETYPAKWKKPNQELVVLMPVFGKANSFFTCNLKTDIKGFAYAGSNNGQMRSEPVEEFKDWMVKHDYDPEHGKDTPMKLQAQAPGAVKQVEPPPPAQ
jgi:hypothetical protein